MLGAAGLYYGNAASFKHLVWQRRPNKSALCRAAQMPIKGQISFSFNTINVETRQYQDVKMSELIR